MAKKTAQKKARSHVSFVDKLLLTKHLAVMIKAGVSLGEAVEILREQAKSQGFKNTLEAISKDIHNGQELTKALEKHPHAFEKFYVNMVKIGESSGTLEENLDFLAGQLSKSYSLRKKIQSAMMYPAMVMTATLVMGAFIGLFILPQLVDFFDAFETELPFSTKILLFVANTMKNYGMFVISGIALSIIVLILFLRLPKIKPLWHALVIKIPLFGKLISHSQLATFSRNLGLSLKSGTPISEALEITADTLNNLRFKKDLLEIKEAVNKGKSISETMKKVKYKEYPPIVHRMIGIGEKTGKLEDTLLYLGDFYEDEIDSITKSLTTTLEPFLLLVIGLIVGFVALAIITPIYELTGSIKQ